MDRTISKPLHYLVPIMQGLVLAIRTYDRMHKIERHKKLYTPPQEHAPCPSPSQPAHVHQSESSPKEGANDSTKSE